MSAASVSTNSGQAKRGFGLVIVLILTVLQSIGSFLLGAIWLKDYLSLDEGLRAYVGNMMVAGSLLTVAGILGIASVVGIWMWKRWGFFGFFLVQILAAAGWYMYSTASVEGSGGFSSFIGAIIWSAIFFFVFRNKMQYLS